MDPAWRHFLGSNSSKMLYISLKTKVFLWNNALNIAMGQCIIAGAVGVWFFTPNAEKGKRGATKESVYNVFRGWLRTLRSNEI